MEYGIYQPNKMLLFTMAASWFWAKCFMVWEITNDYKLCTGRDTNESSNGLL